VSSNVRQSWGRIKEKKGYNQWFSVLNHKVILLSTKFEVLYQFRSAEKNRPNDYWSTRIYQFMVCEVDFMAEKQICSASISIFTPTTSSRLWHGRISRQRYVFNNTGPRVYIIPFYKIPAIVPYAEGQLQLSYPTSGILKFIK